MMRKTPTRVETPAKMERRKKEIGKTVMAQERRKIMGGDRTATKETRTEINLKIPFLSPGSMVVLCKTNLK